MAARCATDATCVALEDCEGWWLSSCHKVVSEHWQLSLVPWIRFPATAGLFTSLYCCHITSKPVYLQHEARSYKHSSETH